MVAALAETGNVSKAAKLAGVGRTTHYEWVAADSEYAAKVAEALDVAADALETEARRRAVDGVDEPVFYKGEECGAIRRYSDTLLIFLLKGVRPEKYRDRVDHRIEDPDAELAKLLGVKRAELPQ